MMTRLLFWLILYPLSLLPLSVLYGIAYLFYLVTRYLLKYRKAVVVLNLQRSFPEKNEQEIKALEKNYYKHLAQIAAEMLKMLTMSRSQLKKRYHCVNPELVNPYFEQGKSVILMSSHYNNWEWMILGLDEMFKHHGIGVGKPNSNKVFEKLINKARTRYGTEVVFADTVRQVFADNLAARKPCAYMMLSDQSPANPDKSYKTTFLNQPSAMIYGSEYFSKKYDIPVFYYAVKKEKRGYYTIKLELITDKPQEESHGFICQRYVELLESTIRQAPAFWLWSHRRWKHEIRSGELGVRNEK